MDQEMKPLISKIIPMVKVLWKSNTIEEMTWETKMFMRNHYQYPSENKCANFGDKIFIRRVEV